MLPYKKIICDITSRISYFASFSREQWVNNPCPGICSHAPMPRVQVWWSSKDDMIQYHYMVNFLQNVQDKHPIVHPWPLQWCYNGCDGVSNHQPHICLLNLLFGCRSKKTSKFRVIGLCAGNSPGTSEFPAQMAKCVHLMTSLWHCDVDGLFVWST